MINLRPFRPPVATMRLWLKEAGEGRRRLLFSFHAEQRMRQRGIGRRQVLETLKRGKVTEPFHQDVRGDWCCNLTWHHAGENVTVAAVIKLKDSGEWVVIATVFGD